VIRSVRLENYKIRKFSVVCLPICTTRLLQEEAQEPKKKLLQT